MAASNSSGTFYDPCSSSIKIQGGRKLLKAGGAQEVVINFENTNTI